MTAPVQSPTSYATKDVYPGVAQTPLTRQRIDDLIARVCVGPHPETVDVDAPFTGEIIARLPLSDEAAVDTAFAIAKRSQREWERTDPAQRARIMRRFGQLVLERRDQGLDLIQWETGKARKDALEELLDVTLTADHYAKVAPKLLRDKRRKPAFPAISRTREIRRPKGVVGVISPWNYPLTLAVTDAIAALMAGNAIVIKPDWQTTLTALWAIDLLYEAGLPDGLFMVVAGDGPGVGAMVVDRANYVMFTGSTGVGRQIAARCGERLVGCSMELGGKNAMVVCADADVSKAAEVAARGSFSNSGQLCISMERIYVHNSIREQFTTAFIDQVATLTQQAGVGWGAQIGSLINQQQLDRVLAHVEDAKSKGAHVLAGGQARPDLGPYFFEPTVLTNVSDDMACFDEETFGPLVSLYGFDSEDDAIRLVNSTSYGLNSSVITRDVKRGRSIGARLNSGTVNVNEAYASAWASLHAPMGGFGDSGLGRRHGVEGLLKYTEAQTIASQHLVGVAPAFGMSDKKFADVMVNAVKAFGAIRR